jgi:hypothetical protein
MNPSSFKVEKVLAEAEPWINVQLGNYAVKWTPSMLQIYLLTVLLAFITGLLVQTFHRAMFRAWVYVKTNFLPRLVVKLGETIIIGFGTFCWPALFCGQYASSWWDAKMTEWAAEVRARVDQYPNPCDKGSSKITPTGSAPLSSNSVKND